MADQPQPGTISAAFPAPPPFYKSFTAQNLARLQSHLDSSAQPTTTTSPATEPTAAAPTIPDLLSLPPELRNLIPPPPPAPAPAAEGEEGQGQGQEGKYRSFGALHQIGPSPSSSSSSKPPVAQNEQLPQTPTPARLLSLTHKLLLTFLSLTNALATNPAGYGTIWDELHECFQEINKVINGYRPHQARETLILMLEGQLGRVEGETRGIGEAVGRARGVVEVMAKEGEGGVGDGDGEMGGLSLRGGSVEGRKGRREREDRRVWEVLEREVGGM